MHPHNVIHSRHAIYLAFSREKYYNYIVLSRAECFCLCMFVQDHNAMRLDSSSNTEEEGNPHGGRPMDSSLKTK